MLTSKEIKKQIDCGNIRIDNLRENALYDPNSISVVLDDFLYTFNDFIVDSRRGKEYIKEVFTNNLKYLKREKIEDSGFLLEPSTTYLAKTKEFISTNGFVPILDGRNSLSILGISIQNNNEYKDEYYNGQLLITIKCTKPTIIYPNIEIGNLGFSRSLDSLSSNIGMLSGEEIKKRIENNDIVITPQDNILINPNSVNLSLNKNIYYYSDKVLDLKKENKIEKIVLDDMGVVLNPNEVYIARTNEWTETYNLVPMLSGRSSLGRLGYHTHCSAGMGSIGYKGYWHMGLRLSNRLKVYENMKCGQIYYFIPDGEIENVYNGSFQGLDKEEIEAKVYQKVGGIKNG